MPFDPLVRHGGDCICSGTEVQATMFVSGAPPTFQCSVHFYYGNNGISLVGLELTLSLSPLSMQAPKKSDWRKKREDFINALRAAKEAQRHLAAGGKVIIIIMISLSLWQYHPKLSSFLGSTFSHKT